MLNNIHVDPSLSVYGLVKRSKQHRTLMNNRRTMLDISREIENAVIMGQVRARLFAGFQKMSAFLPQVSRYQKLANYAESVYVFAYPDVPPPAITNVRYVPLSKDDQLTKEWFLIVEAQEYFSALSTEELGQQGIFEGVWSFDEEMVTILQEWLTSMVDARPMGDLKGHRNYRKQVSLMGDTLVRMTARKAAGK
jgi:DICT domain-containing protein